MSFDKKFNKDLLSIIALIEQGNIENENGALQKFKEHVKEVSTIGRFSLKEWNLDWRSNVYNFGTKFKNLNPIDFLNILTETKINLDKDKQEVLDFYYSEIDINSLPQESCTSRLENFIYKYPYNPEFRHSFGHFYNKNGDFLKAIEQYKFALEKDKENDHFINSLFAGYQSYLESLVDGSKYEEGLKISEELVKNKVFWEHGILHNYLVGITERFKDYILLNQKIHDAEISIKEIVSKETQKSQLKIVEILGFFTAIIAFIFSTVSIGKNYTFKEAIVFNISLGITLMTFVIMISLFFSSKSVKLTDYRITLFLSLVLSLFLILYSYG